MGVDRSREVGRKCYGCGGSGHLVRDCPEKPKSRGNGAIISQSDSYRGNWRGRGRGYSGNVEYGNCALTQEETEPKVVASCCVPKETALESCCISDTKVHLQCGHELPIVSVRCNDST